MEKDEELIAQNEEAMRNLDAFQTALSTLREMLSRVTYEEERNG